MTERDVNIEYVKNKFRDAKLDLNIDELNLILDLISESYVNGFEQGRFDVVMDVHDFLDELMR